MENHQREIWERRQQPDHLGQTEVHLWSVPLQARPEILSDFRSILSSDEKERADRFRRTYDSECYVMSRGSLRFLLGAYLATVPAKLRFVYDSRGKPGLSAPITQMKLDFSVSHSGEEALLGFARGRRIGVDLERVDTEMNILELAERFFSSNEFQILRSLSPERQSEAFYRAWTRKEAYLKARGEGISFGLEKVEVAFAPEEPASIIKVPDDPNASTHWVVKHLSPAQGYIGAAAVEGSDVAFSFLKWEPPSRAGA